MNDLSPIAAGQAAPRGLSRPRAAFGPCFLEPHRPVISLRRCAAKNPSRPHQLEGAESFPRRIAIHHAARDEKASKRGRIEAVAAEPARQPQSGTELADLRHSMNRMTQRARPSILARHVAELRVGPFYVGDQRVCVLPRIAFPCRQAPRPQQTVAVDATVVIVGEFAVTN